MIHAVCLTQECRHTQTAASPRMLRNMSTWQEPVTWLPATRTLRLVRAFSST